MAEDVGQARRRATTTRMVRVVWTKLAIDRLESIRSYISISNPYAADRLAGRIFAAGQSLSEFPRRGRPARDDCRELVVHRSYVILYQISAETVSILDVRHAAQLQDEPGQP
ncbi:type II toxin-antitoxin system RelE/ParE family toxin [Sphingomonas sp. AP4-R1]|uniref:type II toxin-antitoxin system RelE/ParE family toxin n=1 Tax=Sphingomonas sp. AP4-R1 TaxID=2735134 RepID=UPI001493AF43|nr:type II toxin-antitoxin system RelE/ParE family toxin [Sphingomonas sp. AP4-R1]QJU60006.1 type II toxin-antitoxin system RelE/ParE family toxin [Sphingomonas sp. AP4-R1]